MSYSIKMLSLEPALLVTWHSDFDFLKEGEALTGEIIGALAVSDHAVFFINDVKDAPFTYDELLHAATAAARGENPLFLHPKIRGVFSVTTSQLVEMAAKGMDSAIFNNTKIRVVDSVETALAMIRAEGA